VSWRLEESMPGHVRCDEHGVVKWNGEVICEKCGACFTTHDDTLRTHAPPRCICRERLMPLPGRNLKSRGYYFSARALCSTCFSNAPGGFDASHHDAGSPQCAGEACKFHGPQLRKLARRAARAR